MRKLWVIVIPLVITLLSSCEGSEYKTFEQMKGVDHYSFEYPSGYRVILNHAYSSPQAVNGVRLVGKLPDGSEIVLGVNIGNPSAEYSDAKGAVDRLLSVTGRELLERSTDTVSGISCEMVTLYTETTDSLTSKFAKTTHFVDYNSRIWDFYVYAERDKAEPVKATFEHLFDTFKILP